VTSRRHVQRIGERTLLLRSLRASAAAAAKAGQPSLELRDLVAGGVLRRLAGWVLEARDDRATGVRLTLTLTQPSLELRDLVAGWVLEARDDRATGARTSVAGCCGADARVARAARRVSLRSHGQRFRGQTKLYMCTPMLRWLGPSTLTSSFTASFTAESTNANESDSNLPPPLN
jgi:hypothetical protein